MTFKFYLWNIKFGKGGAYALNLPHLSAASEVLFHIWEQRYYPDELYLVHDSLLINEAVVLSELLDSKECQLYLKNVFTKVFNNAIDNITMLFRVSLGIKIDRDVIVNLLREQKIVEKAMLITGYGQQPYYLNDIIFCLVHLYSKTLSNYISNEDMSKFRRLHGELYFNESAGIYYQKKVYHDYGILTLNNVLTSYLHNIPETIKSVEGYLNNNAESVLKQGRYYISLSSIYNAIRGSGRIDVDDYHKISLSIQTEFDDKPQRVSLSSMIDKAERLNPYYAGCKLNQIEAIALFNDLINQVTRLPGDKRSTVEQLIGNFLFDSLIGYPQ